MNLTPHLPVYLTTDYIDAFVRQALAEDIGAGDITTTATVPENRMAEARFLAKEDGVLAGLFPAEWVMKAVDPELDITWFAEDGDVVRNGTRFGTVMGKARSILQAERVTLNLLQRMCGIASATRQMVLASSTYKARILDTRKTVPGLRLLDKWAVLLGGGENHRIGLFDMILIKDNHIVAAGGVKEAITAAVIYRDRNAPGVKIEIEAATLQDVDAVLDSHPVDFILLDNMVRLEPDGTYDCSRLKEAVDRVGGRIRTEASGNVVLASIRAIAATGVDYISCGALTHSTRALDISLKITL